MPHSYGWIPSLPDHRDLAYTYPMGIVVPAELHLRDEFDPPVLDQDGLGSCTAFAGKHALAFADHYNSQETENISELFQYYQERVIEHSTSYDSGANMRDIFKVMKKYGMVDESLWPYDTSKFATHPPKTVYNAAKTDRIHSYQRLSQARSLMQACIAARRAFLIGISVYESFETDHVAKTGEVPLPDSNEALLGGHAVCICGYSDRTERYDFLNSWGDWGQNGGGTIPYQYLESNNLAGDLWTLTVL